MGRSAPRYAKRKDKNHSELAGKLEDVGMVVLDCAAKGFYTDLLVGWRGVWAFLEVKNPERVSKKHKENLTKTLTDTEEALREMSYRNDLPFKIVLDADEAIEYMTRLTT